MSRDQSQQNRRSRDVPPRERAALVAAAEAVRDSSPSRLAAAGIPLSGNAGVYHRPGGARRKSPPAPVQIFGVTTQALAREMAFAVGGKICVFIACSHSKPGGGWLSGAVAQEESVSRESTWAVQCSMFPSWHKSSTDWTGPAGALVIDGLSFFSGTDTPVVFAGVCAANKNACPPAEWDAKRELRVSRLADAVEAGLHEGARRGCTGAVLCAFGTGVFGWEPADAMEAISLGVSRSGVAFPVRLAAGNQEAALRLSHLSGQTVTRDSGRTKRP